MVTFDQKHCTLKSRYGDKEEQRLARDSGG
jgi:hypothetical protein